MSERFANNLKKYRELAGFKQAKDFAKNLNIPYTTYSAYEKQGREPRYDVLCQIADLLHVTTDKLLGHEVKNNGSYEKWKRKLQKYGFRVITKNNNVIVSFSDGQSKDNDKKECLIKYDSQVSFINDVSNIINDAEEGTRAIIRGTLYQIFKIKYQKLQILEGLGVFGDEDDEIIIKDIDSFLKAVEKNRK